MKVGQKGKTIIIQYQSDTVEAFIDKINNAYDQFVNHHLILDLSTKSDFINKNLKLFETLVKKHSKAKKSLIIVAPNIDFNKVSSKINVVPTLQEANDIIEMEEIERDLGF
jgi:hypothetical protein